MPDLLTELRSPAVAMTEKSLGDLCREAADEIERLRGHLRWFCNRVDRGEVRSKQTYKRFKAELKE